MNRVRTVLAILAALCAFSAPAQAQRVADVAPGATSHTPSAPPSAAAATVIAPSRELPAALQPAAVDLGDAAGSRRVSVAGHTAIGAGAGALAGGLLFLGVYALDEECRSADSMCGLAIPVMVGSGAVTGSIAGLVVGLIRNR